MNVGFGKNVRSAYMFRAHTPQYIVHGFVGYYNIYRDVPKRNRIAYLEPHSEKKYLGKTVRCP
jgi:hypothetical protein